MNNKILVPDGMMKAGRSVTGWRHSDGSGRSPLMLERQVRDILKAALLWWSENPIVPDVQRLTCGCDGMGREDDGNFCYFDDVVSWQRRMFLAPETEPMCPVEKTLRENGVKVSNDWLCPECERVHEAIIPPAPKSECLHPGEFKCVGCGESISIGLVKKDAPEPEVPEGIADLISNYSDEDQRCNPKIIEAYRRGEKKIRGEEKRK